ncbi:GGDEF domain-containing protein [Thalassotalea atypica]|uniref:GGDEF domain-containing protein n=1 Tax=Thalassotalea atypica TaxID=2054316 RepID=UPI002572C761|nr:GGDEF domain-containing protein [Thalassotalea atypica]
MELSSLYNIGAGSLVDPKASKVRIANIVTLITCLVATMYAAFFLVSLEQPMLAAMNFGFVIAYASSIVFTYFKQYVFAKLWLFVVLMIHVFILTTYVFTASASFHFYYLLLPCGIFLLFDDEDQVEKLFVIISGTALFFYCHVFVNQEPLIQLSPQVEQSIFISAITVIILEIYFVMSLFSRSISRHQLELNKLATIDPLTGLSNRRTLMTLGEEFFEHAKRYEKQFSVLLLDVDLFKQVNDKYGHLVGDEVLKAVSQALQSNTRASDVVARYGGEEFVVLLPETSLFKAKDIAEQLRGVIEKARIELPSQAEIHCTASFGVTAFEPNANDFPALINQADYALYQAKNNGRNQVLLFEQDSLNAI